MLKDEYFAKAIEWASKKGFSDLKANYEEYETPHKYMRANSDTPFIPDITGTKSGRKFYIEIATKSEDDARSVSKWKLLSTLASMKDGKLFLLAPKGHKSFVEGMIKKHHVEADLIYLPSV